jgi:ABC-type nitrate/sulfonate/bicarbonate transport system permease component
LVLFFRPLRRRGLLGFAHLCRSTPAGFIREEAKRDTSLSSIRASYGVGVGVAVGVGVGVTVGVEVTVGVGVGAITTVVMPVPSSGSFL